MGKLFLGIQVGPIYNTRVFIRGRQREMLLWRGEGDITSGAEVKMINFGDGGWGQNQGIKADTIN